MTIFKVHKQKCNIPFVLLVRCCKYEGVCKISGNSYTLPTSRTILPLLKRNGKVEDKIFWPQSWVNHISIPCPLVFQSTFPNFAIGSISSVKCWWIPDWGDRLKLEGKGTERLLPIAPASCSKIYKKIVPISHQKIRQNTHKDVKLKSKNCRQYTATGCSSKNIPRRHN